MPSRCAYCPSLIQDDDTFVAVHDGPDGGPTRAHVRCAETLRQQMSPKEKNFRERVALDDRPEVETPPRPKDKELRG